MNTMSSDVHVGIDAAVTGLTALGHSYLYPAGVELFPQEVQLADVFALERGMVKLMRIDASGRELLLGLRLPGSLIGAFTAISRQATPVAAITLCRCRLRRIAIRDLQEALKMAPELSWQLQELHCREIHEQMSHIARLLDMSPRQRLESLLVDLVRVSELTEGRSSIRLDLPLKQGELARLIGITPEHLSRILSQMKRDGVLDRAKGWVIVRGLAGLGGATLRVQWGGSAGGAAGWGAVAARAVSGH
jgi:CRP-like cAMP-binding protein